MLNKNFNNILLKKTFLALIKLNKNNKINNLFNKYILYLLNNIKNLSHFYYLNIIINNTKYIYNDNIYNDKIYIYIYFIIIYTKMYINKIEKLLENKKKYFYFCKYLNNSNTLKLKLCIFNIINTYTLNLYILQNLLKSSNYYKLFNKNSNLKYLEKVDIFSKYFKLKNNHKLSNKKELKKLFFVSNKKELKNLSFYFHFQNNLKLFYFFEIQDKLISFYNVKYNSNLNFKEKFIKIKNSQFFNNFNTLNYKYNNYDNNKVIDNYFINNFKLLYFKEHLRDLLNNKAWFIKSLNLQSNWFYFLDLNYKNKNFYFILKKKHKILNSKYFILKSWTPRILKLAKKSAKDKSRFNIIEASAIEVGKILKNNYNIISSKLIITLKTNLRLKYNLKALAGLRKSGYFVNKNDHNSIESIKFLNKTTHNGIRKKKVRRL